MLNIYIYIYIYMYSAIFAFVFISICMFMASVMDYMCTCQYIYIYTYTFSLYICIYIHLYNSWGTHENPKATRGFKLIPRVAAFAVTATTASSPGSGCLPKGRWGSCDQKLRYLSAD